MLAQVGEAAYKLDLRGHYQKIHPVFHTSLLKPFVPGGSSDTPPDPIEVDDQLEYVVEDIVSRKGRGRGLRFLVRW